MEETIKERRLRYILVVFFVLITASAIFSRSDKIGKRLEKEDYHFAVVVKESNNYEENPIIALYNNNNDLHILTYYEIDLKNNYHFRAIDAVTLKSAPSRLSLDKNKDGVWVNINKKWHYFNKSLQSEENDSKNIEKERGQSVNFLTKKDDDNLEISISDRPYNDKQFTLANSEAPKSIYSLSSDGSLWLVLFEEEVSIAIAR